MPNWKKLIVSGSDATLNSLNISTGAVVSGSLTASLFANGSDNQYFHIDNRYVSESYTDGNIGIQFSYGGNYQSRIISRKSQDFVGNLDYDGDLVIQQRFNSNNLDTAIFNQRGGLKLPVDTGNNVGLNITRGENNAPLLWLSTDDNDAFDNFYTVNISGSIVATSFDLGDTFKIRATNSYNKATDDSSSNARDYFKIDDANEVTVFGHGNVGIGTATSSQKLRVQGNFRVSSGYALMINDASPTEYVYIQPPDKNITLSVTSSNTTYDPQFIIRQDGNAKAQFGWDDDGGNELFIKKRRWRSYTVFRKFYRIWKIFQFRKFWCWNYISRSFTTC